MPALWYSVDEKICRLERRQEQMSNLIMNRRRAHDGVNITSLTDAIRNLQGKQNLIASSLSDMKKVIGIIFNTIHGKIQLPIKC